MDRVKNTEKCGSGKDNLFWSSLCFFSRGSNIIPRVTPLEYFGSAPDYVELPQTVSLKHVRMGFQRCSFIPSKEFCEKTEDVCRVLGEAESR